MYIIPLLPVNRGSGATVHWNSSLICIFWIAVARSLSVIFTVSDARLFPLTVIGLRVERFLLFFMTEYGLAVLLASSLHFTTWYHNMLLRRHGG